MASFHEDSLYDVIVVGLGGHGSSIAAHLAKRGVRVLGLEKFGPVHGEGSSHGHSRIIRQAYFEDPKYVPLLQRSFALWRDLHRDQGSEEDPVLVMTGAMMVGYPESEVVSGTLRSIREHNLDHEVLDAAALRERFPACKPADGEIAVIESEGGYLVPEKCIAAYHAQARLHGADLHFNEAVVSWTSTAPPPTLPSSLSSASSSLSSSSSSSSSSPSSEVLEEKSPSEICTVVSTTGATYRAKKLVLAVGAWAPELYGSHIPMNLWVERRVLFWMEPTDGFDNFRSFPVYIWEVGSSNFYGFPYQPLAGPPGVKVAMHYSDPVIRQRQRCDPMSIDRSVHSVDSEDLRKLLDQKIPSLSGRIVGTATCMYTLTRDEHFLIDFAPSHDNVLLVSACSGHGFKFCSVVGELCAELLLDGKTALDTSLFRFKAERN